MKQSRNHEITHLGIYSFLEIESSDLQKESNEMEDTAREVALKRREWPNVKIHFTNQINLSSLSVVRETILRFLGRFSLASTAVSTVVTRSSRSRFSISPEITVYLHRIAVFGRHVYHREIGSPKRNLTSRPTRACPPYSWSRKYTASLKFYTVQLRLQQKIVLTKFQLALIHTIF